MEVVSKSTLSLPRTTPFRVEGWRVEPELNAVTSETGTRRLGSTVMGLWVTLVRRAGRLVTKEQLIEEVWQGKHVTDDAVTVAVYELRKLLGDKARAPRYIETIPGRGYRWLVEVEWEVPTRSTLSPSAGATPSRDPAPLGPPALDPAEPGESRTRPSKVEPPVEMAGEPPWSSNPPRATAPERRFSPYLEMAVLLGLLAWIGLNGADTQGDAAPASSVPAPSAPVFSPEALDAYVRGLAYLRQASPQGAKKAVESLREATELAPTHGRAWAGLAEAYAQQFEMGLELSPGLLERARTTASHAVALEPDHVGAVYAMGLVELLSYERWPLAEPWFERTLALDPTSGRGWQGMTWVHLAEGRVEEAYRAAQHGVLLDPHNPDAITPVAMLQFILGDPEEALATLRAARERGLTFQVGHLTLQSSIEVHLGDLEGAKATYLDILTALDRPIEEEQRLEALYTEEGFDAMLRFFLDTAPGLTHLTRALRLVVLGDTEEALQALEAGARGEESEMLLVAAHPGFRALDGMPRYEAIVAKLGLAKPRATARDFSSPRPQVPAKRP